MLLSKEVPWSYVGLNYIFGNHLKDVYIKVQILKKEKSVQMLLSWSKQEVSPKLMDEGRMCMWETFIGVSMKIRKRGLQEDFIYESESMNLNFPFWAIGGAVLLLRELRGNKENRFRLRRRDSVGMMSFHFRQAAFGMNVG